MKSLMLLSIAALIAVAACTRDPNAQVAQVPTLAVLPTETRDPSLPTSLPTVTPTFTLSPVPTAPPVPTSTPLPPCDMAGWWKTVDATVVQFFDTVEVASATPRDSLSPVLLQLRQTFRDFQRADAPDCAKAVQGEISAGMEAMAVGFNGVLSDDTETTSAGVLTAVAHFWAAMQILTPYGITPDKRLTEFAGLDSSIPVPMNALTATWLAQLGSAGLMGTWNAATSQGLDTQIADDRATLRISDPGFAAQLDTQDANFNITLTAIYSK